MCRTSRSPAPASAPARSPAARAPTARMTRGCTPMPFPPIRPGARASCACSPISTRRASRAPGAWESEAQLLRALRVTKRSRSEYDHLMLQLHDRVKADTGYQQQAPQQRIDFPVGSTWIVFSDQVLHAAMRGQFVMEETLMLNWPRIAAC